MSYRVEAQAAGGDPWVLRVPRFKTRSEAMTYGRTISGSVRVWRIIEEAKS